MPAIATSVEVVVAIASAISPIIGGNAFTGNGRRFVPSGRKGVGVGQYRSSPFFFSYIKRFIFVTGNIGYAAPLSGIVLS